MQSLQFFLDRVAGQGNARSLESGKQAHQQLLAAGVEPSTASRFGAWVAIQCEEQKDETVLDALAVHYPDEFDEEDIETLREHFATRRQETLLGALDLFSQEEQ